MDGDTYYTIGELARRTGLAVRTVRFYSDRGIVPPTARTAAGYRVYDVTAVARLDLVRTLRDLGVGLATVRRVLAHEVTLTEVATAHAAALDAQIRALRLRRAVLRAVARTDPGPEGATLMHRLAQLSDVERDAIINDFLDAVFGGLDVDPTLQERMRAVRPHLPDDPTPEQVAAWVELAELVQDDSFRTRLRQMTEAAAAWPGGDGPPGHDPDLVDRLQHRVGGALAAGLPPSDASADPVVDELADAFARGYGREDGPEFRGWLADVLAVGTDPRAERYWQLLAVMHDWPQWEPAVPAFQWFIDALRARS